MRIVIGEGSCGIAAGAKKLHSALSQLGAEVGITGCIGMCYTRADVIGSFANT